ncbi:MAG: hypothetical protein U5K81_07180 [Trueperaceae bacterium]|nr:hypothetical protein [Trueperaceae bacterium]
MTTQVADRLRRPFFVAAVVLAVFVILIEVGASTWLPAIVPTWADGDVRTVGAASRTWRWWTGWCCSRCR